VTPEAKDHFDMARQHLMRARTILAAGVGEDARRNAASPSCADREYVRYSASLTLNRRSDAQLPTEGGRYRAPLDEYHLVAPPSELA
jgi:hypothetical protein